MEIPETSRIAYRRSIMILLPVGGSGWSEGAQTSLLWLRGRVRGRERKTVERVKESERARTRERGRDEREEDDAVGGGDKSTVRDRQADSLCGRLIRCYTKTHGMQVKYVPRKMTMAAAQEEDLRRISNFGFKAKALVHDRALAPLRVIPRFQVVSGASCLLLFVSARASSFDSCAHDIVSPLIFRVLLHRAVPCIFLSQ